MKEKVDNIKIEDFFEKEYKDFAIYSSYRSIASYVDGLKNVHRKIIWTVDKNNITTEKKVVSIAAKAMDETEYLHGDKSIQDAVITLAKNYPGTNNLNLLEPKGNYGYRTDHTAAAPRYIMTNKSQNYDSIIKKIDRPILEIQNFEGTNIEPKYLLPIVPLILINGSEGIGTGFAQKIMSRDPKRIITILKNYLKKGTNFNHIIPFIKNYKGDIYIDKDNPNKVWYKGLIKKKNTTTLIIEELPIQYDIDSYIKVLQKLIENKVIKSYKDGSIENIFYIEVKCERTLTQKTEEELINIFELKKSITENFTCITEDNSIIVFKNEKELLNKFIEFRLKKYEDRRQYILKIKTEELSILEEKIRFIKNIIEEKLIINKKTKKEIETQLIKQKFKKNNDNYDYLLSMAIYNLTKEYYDKQIEKSNILKNEIKTITNKTNKELWLEDLEDLKL